MRAVSEVFFLGVGMARAREVVKPGRSGKRFVRRGKKGQFTKEQAEMGRSLSRDRRTKAKRKVKKGQGDRGDVATGGSR